jgi:hypothetical protein
MKIIVKDSDMNLKIILPSRLVLNSLTAYLAPHFINRKTGADKNGSVSEITGKQLRLIFREINRYRRKHRDWVLLEAESGSSGEKVMIKL